MDKNEVITLSSDEESDFTTGVDQAAFKSTKPEISSPKIVEDLDKFKKITSSPNVVNNLQKNEIIDIVDCSEKPVGNNHFQIKESAENPKNHSKPNISINEPLTIRKKLITERQKNKISADTGTNNNETGTKDVMSEVTIDTPKLSIKCKGEFQNKISKASDGSNQNLQFFTEFVEYCGFLEEVETDRAKLTKKLMKRYGEADCHYIKSEEFRCLIQKFRDKVTKNNLYIIAKEVSDELIYRKKIAVKTGKTEKPCQRSEEPDESVENIDETQKKGNKKQTKVINKIIRQLDKLGLKIRELEEKEVDLSDEEDSAYLQLQRYRERFYKIYTKLCKFTNKISDVDHIYNPKIFFTESKYPEINKCIEKWLNKTKRFPDFSDIMKLLESQSSSLNLPSNREAIRLIATEIFQQVGRMLQRKRTYDLWDSLCGFLNDGEDPASKDVLLDEVLKRNFEDRVKKEQEIFQYYSELQEKQRLEPEEVPDEEANRSPVESGNEDEEERENTEEQISRRLDDAFEEDTEGIDDETIGKNESNKEKHEEMDQTPKADNTQSKESKNNFKNCKSLKWRTETGSKVSVNSEDANAEQEIEKEKKKEAKYSYESESVKKDVDESDSKKVDNNDSDLELIAVKNVKLETMDGIYSKVKAETKSIFRIPTKRTLPLDDVVPKKVMRSSCGGEDNFEVFEIDDENENPKKKINEVIDVHCCRIFADNFFEDFEEGKKDWGKRKVFRDLTNLNRLMELHGKRKKGFGLFSPQFFHRSFYEFEKPSWKKKFRMSFRSVGSWDQKCALNQEEHSGKTVNSASGGDSDEKDIQNNSKGKGADEGNNFFSGHGSGDEGDNNEDENRRNARADVEPNESQREEDEEEEEDENNAESTEHSLPKQKTEERLESEKPSEPLDKSNDELTQGHEAPSENPKDEKKEDKGESSPEVEDKGESNPEVEDKGESNPEVEDKGESNSEVEDKEFVPDDVDKKQSEEPELEEKAVEAEESVPEKEERETVNKNNEVTVEEKPVEDVNVTKCNSVNQNSEVVKENKTMPPKETHKDDSTRTNSTVKVIETHKLRARAGTKDFERVKPEKKKHLQASNKPATAWKSSPVDSSPQKLRKRNAPSTSDEEIVKRFLLHSPSSISITPPRKLSLTKAPSQAALQALATLRNLKGISATIVRGKPKNDAVGGSYARRSDHNNQNLSRRGRSDFPVISNAQTVTPKIVNVSGNVSGFDSSWPGISNATCDSSPLKISNVWGSLPNNNFIQTRMPDTPGCSSQKNNPGPSNSVKKKNTKKTVEYVVLD